MPAFDAKTLDCDPDGLTLLAAILHPAKPDRNEALRRGRERLAQANPFGSSTKHERTGRPGCFVSELPAA